MYYVNREQIEERLSFLPQIAEGCRLLAAGTTDGAIGPLQAYAQERLLHLAVEAVTDVGSLLIDGFLMREASSYEDIVDVLAGEGVVGPEAAAFLTELVRLRRPLVQEYVRFERSRIHPLIPRLPDHLEAFARAVRDYLQRELG